MTRDAKDLIVALDIGTSKVLAVVAEALPDGRFEVLGLGQHPSHEGMRKGVVVNIEATVNAIQRAVGEAELMADCKIREVYTGIAGQHIASFNSSGMVAVKDKEVTAADVTRAIETARAVNIPAEQQVLHVLEQEYIVDNLEGIRDPVGMSGLRLEVRVHIVTGASSSVQNIIKCVRRCGLEVQYLTLQPLASSLACLTHDEKELGVVLVDIGAGTSDVAIYTHGAIRHTEVVPIAGNQITNDIAAILNTPISEAEDIKLRHGIAKQALADPDDMIEVPGLGDRPQQRLHKRQALAAVIESRVEELLMEVRERVRASGYADLVASGVVLTGGAALMPGMVDVAEDVFSKPVRVALPVYDGSLKDIMRSPRFSTVMGLLMEARRLHEHGRKSVQQTGWWGARWARIKEWFLN